MIYINCASVTSVSCKQHCVSTLKCYNQKYLKIKTKISFPVLLKPDLTPTRNHNPPNPKSDTKWDLQSVFRIAMRSSTRKLKRILLQIRWAGLMQVPRVMQGTNSQLENPQGLRVWFLTFSSLHGLQERDKARFSKSKTMPRRIHSIG